MLTTNNLSSTAWKIIRENTNKDSVEYPRLLKNEDGTSVPIKNASEEFNKYFINSIFTPLILMLRRMTVLMVCS